MVEHEDEPRSERQRVRAGAGGRELVVALLGTIAAAGFLVEGIVGHRGWISYLYFGLFVAIAIVWWGRYHRVHRQRLR